MPDYLPSYFHAEKQESAVFVAMGLAAIAAAIRIWQRHPRFRTIAYPLVAIAVIQLVVGGAVFARTESQVAALVEQRRADPAAFRAAEGARMAQVMENFQIYKAIEIAMLIGGVGLVILCRKRPALAAIGLGCMLQGGAMLAFDLFAETRGRTYVEAIGRG
ncbi:MAG TPA: hypothetical protein VK540_28455 [Polyangiaceae bacterium]|nr:hypothetical protein [Polyangiaceae bacterium]